MPGTGIAAVCGGSTAGDGSVGDARDGDCGDEARSGGLLECSRGDGEAAVTGDHHSLWDGCGDDGGGGGDRGGSGGGGCSTSGVYIDERAEASSETASELLLRPPWSPPPQLLPVRLAGGTPAALSTLDSSTVLFM